MTSSAQGDLAREGEARGRELLPPAPWLLVICLLYPPPTGREGTFLRGFPDKAFSHVENTRSSEGRDGLEEQVILTLF